MSAATKCWLAVLLNIGLAALNIWLYTRSHHWYSIAGATVNLLGAVWCAYCAIDIARMDREHDAFLARLASAQRRRDLA